MNKLRNINVHTSTHIYMYIYTHIMLIIHDSSSLMMLIPSCHDNDESDDAYHDDDVDV